MNPLTELVDLPDPRVQPLLHPLDLPAARPAWRQAWWAATLTQPAVAVAAAVAVWFATGQYALAAVLGIAILAVGLVATPCVHHQAWAFIPRKRQDRDRALPLRWQLATQTVSALAWAATMLLLAVRLADPAVPASVRATMFGVATGCGLALLAGLLAAAWREHGSAVVRLPVALGVGGSTALGYWLLFGWSRAGLSSYSWSAMAVMVAVVALGKLVQHRLGHPPHRLGR